MNRSYYIIPFGIFLLLTEIGSLFPEKAYLFYTVKTFLVAGLLFYWRKHFAELQHKASKVHLLLGIPTGLLLVYLWVAFDRLLPRYGESYFNPFGFGLSQTAAWLILGVRLFGAVLVVPFMEELFWRSFFMRYLINKDFRKVPLGTYQPFAFWTVAILFGLEHFRIIPGFLAGVVYGFLVCRTKSLWPAILSHTVTNLGLGFYVLLTGQWQFW